jgi:hypothetical protein
VLDGKPMDADKKYKVVGWAPVSEEAKAAGGEAIWDVSSAIGPEDDQARTLNLPARRRGRQSRIGEEFLIRRRDRQVIVTARFATRLNDGRCRLGETSTCRRDLAVDLQPTLLDQAHRPDVLAVSPACLQTRGSARPLPRCAR